MRSRSHSSAPRVSGTVSYAFPLPAAVQAKSVKLTGTALTIAPSIMHPRPPVPPIVPGKNIRPNTSTCTISSAGWHTPSHSSARRVCKARTTHGASNPAISRQMHCASTGSGNQLAHLHTDATPDGISSTRQIKEATCDQPLDQASCFLDRSLISRHTKLPILCLPRFSSSWWSGARACTSSALSWDWA